MVPGPVSFNPDNRQPTLQEWLGLCLIFVLAYGQAPLYTSNQNQYFLHGLARAGFGELHADWLAGTLDPTPLFSALVWLIHTAIGSWFFYVQYGLIMAAYLISLTAIARSTASALNWRFPTRFFLVAMVVVHSQAFRTLLSLIPGEHWEYLVEAGVAGQRLLGPVLQPSSTGVLLLAGLALSLQGRYWLAAAVTALAASFHPTYLLSAAILTAAFTGYQACAGRGWSRAVPPGGIAFLLVLPITLYTAAVFSPTGPETWRLAAETLVEFRIPHHAIPRQWFDLTVLIKLAILGAALTLAWRYRPLAVPLAALALIGSLLTLAAVLTDDLRLALLMPWRVSVLLVPAATSVLIARGLAIIRLERYAWLRNAAVLAAVLAAAAGIAAFVLLQERQARAPFQGIFDRIAAGLGPSQTYLIPPKLQEFRLATGAPAFVDFKSIPYRDHEVLEWYERVRLAQFFYRDDPDFVDCGLLEAMSAHQVVTHVLLGPELADLACPQLEFLYSDTGYSVFQMKSEGSP